MPKLPTDPAEFKRFHLLLTRGRPEYEPHYIRVNAGDAVGENGNPTGKKAAGKHTKMTFDAAIKRLERGVNVGIEATDSDRWVIIDVDDIEVVSHSEMKPTLTMMSRSRAGYHYIYWAADPNDRRLLDVTNAPFGEIRSNNEYVVAPGSWVATTDITDEIPADQIENAGKYTIESDAPIAEITFDELPQAFKDVIEAKAAPNAAIEKIAAERKARKATHPETTKDGSALFDLQLSDVITIPRGNPNSRFVNPLHPGGKGLTAGISDRGYLQCYSHSVSHTALSTLAVLADVTTCEHAGQGFGNATVGGSAVDYKDGRTLWKMWSHAVKAGMLPKDDPIMWDALRWYAIDAGICTEADLTEGYRLPPGAVKRTKNIIKSKEGIEIINIGTKKPKPAASAPPSNPNVGGELDDYFINKTFIPMVLGNRIMSRGNYKTMKDTGEIFRYADGVYIGKAAADIEAAAQVALDYKSNTHRINEVVGYIRRATYVDRTDFDTDKNIINLENGLFDFETMELKPHTPKYLSLHKSPIFYDPAAICPRTDQFFGEVLQAKDIILMYELFGYALVKDKRMSEAIIFEGATGHNGKSTMIELLNTFVGAQATSGVSPNQMEGDIYAVASMFGALLNTVDDLGNTPLSKLGTFKSIVACKPIDAQHKFERRFRFKPDALCVFACNDVPPTTDTSDAFFGRMIIIPFIRSFRGADKDPHLIDKLTTKEAISGLFNVAIAAAKGAIEAGEFTGAGTVESKKMAYTYASNSVAQFIDDQCAMDDPDDYTSKNALYQAYILWARDHGIKTKDMGTMTMYLKTMGITEGQPEGDNGARVRSYMGIRIKVVI